LQVHPSTCEEYQPKGAAEKSSREEQPRVPAEKSSRESSPGSSSAQEETESPAREVVQPNRKYHFGHLVILVRVFLVLFVRTFIINKEKKIKNKIILQYISEDKI